ncbi:hypothetical protein GOV14_00785 [Candidatus Pacearchaeota archaeon]|nr:hypothetical protein [Candidatus Pacearchaeota archaeon]
MLDFGSKKQNKKFKTESVLKESSKRGYIWVNPGYLLQEHEWIKRNTTLPKMTQCGNTSPSVYMISNLMTYMFQRQKPWWMIWKSDEEYKRWILLRKDHWIVDHQIREELLKQRKI